MKWLIGFSLLMLERTAHARGGVGEVIFIAAIGLVLLLVVGSMVHLSKKENKESGNLGSMAVKIVLYLGGLSVFIWSLGTDYGLWVIGAIVVISFMLKIFNKKN